MSARAVIGTSGSRQLDDSKIMKAETVGGWGG